MYSDRSTIELLPALSCKFPQGKICGIMTRAGVCIDELEWNREGKLINIKMTALRDTHFQLVLGNAAADMLEISDEDRRSFNIDIELKKGEQCISFP